MLLEQKSIAVIGGGPAGLRAAEVAATAGASVTLYDAQRSVGRKFLVAGKSGLNLTNSAKFEDFVRVYSGDQMPAEFWTSCLADFDNTALCEWAEGLGIKTHPSSSGKVFPVQMKAAPLLRRWVERLRSLGVKFEVNHRWTGLQPGGGTRKQSAPNLLTFQTHAPQPVTVHHDSVVLALGGGSWPQTGSTGDWVSILKNLGIKVRRLEPANCGWECPWTPATRAKVEGRPLHNIEVRAGDTKATGELMLTRYGLEGTVIYALGRALRAMSSPAIHIDFKPTLSEEALVHKMGAVGRNFLNEAFSRWKLSESACVILEQFHAPFDSAAHLARTVKSCRLPLSGPRPLVEAISTAGGVCWSELEPSLMLRKLPGIYCAGEMIDWEAPTGGYLLQGCFATGTRAGAAAAGGLVDSDL